MSRKVLCLVSFFIISLTLLYSTHGINTFSPLYFFLFCMLYSAQRVLIPPRVSFPRRPPLQSVFELVFRILFSGSPVVFPFVAPPAHCLPLQDKLAASAAAPGQVCFDFHGCFPRCISFAPALVFYSFIVFVPFLLFILVIFDKGLAFSVAEIFTFYFSRMNRWRFTALICASTDPLSALSASFYSSLHQSGSLKQW